MRDFILIFLITVMAGAFAGLIINGYTDCQFNNGDYVRGLFWMECINEK